MKKNIHLLRPKANMFSRLDLYAFVTAFFAGLVIYLLLEFAFHLNKIVISLAIVAVMVLYALVVLSVPRLRVRLDQAGDNAYYLGLLFTLVSMVIALFEFETATTSETGIMAVTTGPQHIVRNFGVALASTITGIFLRVFLHQMRIDPSEVEGMTRIELAEASRKVQASIDLITNDLGRFHEELRQKSYDLVKSLVEDAEKSIVALGKELERATNEMLVSTGSVHKNVLEQTEGLTQLLARTASEAAGAIERLRAVEQPPVILSRRFERVAKTLETTGDQTERIALNLQSTADSAKAAMEGISLASTELSRLAQQVASSQADVCERVGVSADSVVTALGSIGVRLEKDRELIGQIEEESNRAQTATVEVLKRLTEITRGVTSALKSGAAGDTNGTSK